MGNQASRQYVIDRLGEYFEWAIAYSRAARNGETNEMERLEAEYNARLKQLEAEADTE